MIPMNMIPFIARMDNTREVEPKPGPTPEPFNPTELIHTIVPFELTIQEERWLPEGSYHVLTPDAEEIEKQILWEESVLPFRFTLDGREFVIITHEAVAENKVVLTEFVYADDPTGTVHSFYDVDTYILLEADSEDPQVILTVGEIDPE